MWQLSSGGEWEHGVVEGPTLRRPWRGWISTVASGVALAVALTLMAVADPGHPGRRLERVVKSLGPGPAADHQGGGNAIGPTRTPAGKAPATSAPVVPGEPQPATTGTAPKARAQLAASVAPTPNLAADGQGAQPAAGPTSPTTRPHVDVPDDSRDADGVGAHRRRRSHDIGRPQAPPRTRNDFRRCPSDDDHDHSHEADHDDRDGRHDRAHEGDGEDNERW